MNVAIVKYGYDGREFPGYYALSETHERHTGTSLVGFLCFFEEYLSPTYEQLGMLVAGLECTLFNY